MESKLIVEKDVKEGEDKELLVAEILRSKKGWNLEKNCKGYDRLDYSVLDPQKRIVAFCEIKTRACKVSDYPHTMIDLGKFEIGARFQEFMNIPFIIVFQFTDGLLVYKHISGNRFIPYLKGRTTKFRGDFDIKPVVYLPVYDLLSLEEVAL